MGVRLAARSAPFGGRRSVLSRSAPQRVAPPRAARIVASAGAVTVLYRTEWQQCMLHYCSADGSWLDAPMAPAPSGKGWRTATVQASDALQFVLHDGDGRWDNADGVPGRNYVAQRQGTYRLTQGQLTLLPPNLPLMLVSDLDGTMVGDDAGTRAFAAYWHGTAAATGSKLVYSTGRALDSFLELAAEKGNDLPRPDVLICAVGTKVYLPAANGGCDEDPAWTARMDEGWDTEKMRLIASEAVQRAGTENAHFRPAAELNAHKLTLGVREAAVPLAVAFIADAAAAAGLRAKVIASGTGGWQYVDVVAAGAGKLESLEYVRAKLRFSRAATVAAGDSGNDVAMLAGRHRAIVVGNAQPDLARWAAAQCGPDGGDSCAFPDTPPPAVAAPPPPRVVVAKDEPIVDVEATVIAAAPAEAPAPAAAPAAAADAAPAADAAAAPAAEAAPVAVADPPAAAAEAGDSGGAAVPVAPPAPIVQPVPVAAAPVAPAPALAVAATDAEEGPLDGPRLYCAAANQAWGVIEGLQHFGFA